MKSPIQAVRNDLSSLEDTARKMRNGSRKMTHEALIYGLIASLIQVIREDIVQ